MKKALVILATLVLSFTANAYDYNIEKDHRSNHENSDSIHTGGEQASSSQVCNDHGRAMSLNNDQVIKWKTSQPNNFRARGYVNGTVDEIFPDMTGHHHFSVKIGEQANDHVEVIYQINFGHMPEPRIGDQVVACGDFINSYAQSGGYQPSPDGAIIHWVHRNPDGHGHDDGFVILNGTLFGNGNGH